MVTKSKPKTTAEVDEEATMSTEVSTFGSLVLDGPLQVPLNQRPWEWRSENLEYLFDDLVETADRWYEQGADDLWERRSSVDDILPHFFGPLVLEEDDGPEQRAIVDGQQRLTATTILVALMRDHARALDTGTAANPARALLTGLSMWLLADPTTGDERPRLRLDDTVAKFFERYVVQASGDAERQAFLASQAEDPVGEAEDVRFALINATRHLGELLAKHLADRHPDGDPNKIVSRLRALFQTLQDAFLVIVVRVLRPGMAPQVFSGLNARGTELNEADKIKNELFLASPFGDHLQIKAAWDSMVRLTPERDAQSFLRFRHIAFVEDTKLADLYYNVRRSEMNKGRTLDVVRRWSEDARLMHIVSGYEEHPNISEATRRHLLDVRLLRHTYVRPLLLTAARAYLAESPEEFAEAALLARNVAFRELSMGRTRPETFLNRIGPITRKVNKGSSIQDLRKDLLVISPDEDFKRNFAHYHDSRSAVQYYILFELELVAGGTSGLVPAPHSPKTSDYANNIEHVLPRTPSRTRVTEFAEWRDPADATHRRKNLSLHRAYVQRIGNLLLIESDINSELGDYDFPAKQSGSYPSEVSKIGGRPRRSYKDSALRLPRELSDQAKWPKWDPAAIETRQEQLAEYAVEAWRIGAAGRRKRSS